jgi:hypothetical protein
LPITHVRRKAIRQAVLEAARRRELRPVIATGAEIMDQLFS